MEHLLYLIPALFGLWLGAEFVVDSAKKIAASFGISTLFIGLTIVSIGASLPEITVSIFSGLKGNAGGIGLGSLVGSCLTQITFILALSAFLTRLRTTREALYHHGAFLLFAIVLFFIVGWTGGAVTRVEGLILVIAYLLYLIHIGREEWIEEHLSHHHVRSHRTLSHPALWALLMLLGIGILVVSGNVVLTHAMALTHSWGVSQAFVGVLLIGVLTCLPELSTAVIAALRGVPQVGVGALIGSNITDPLLSAGLGAAIQGFQADRVLFSFDVPFWFFATLFSLALFARNKSYTLSRNDAGLIFLVYGAFVVLKVAPVL